MRTRFLVALMAGLFVAPLAAGAAVIDFDAHPSDFTTPIFDSGFQFDFTAAGWGVFGPGSVACCNVNYNGTPAMFADGDRGEGRANVIMTMVGGGAFDIYQLDAAVYWVGASGSLGIIGSLQGGGTISTTLTSGTPWQTFSLTGFTNLVSVTFQDTQSGAFLGAPGFGIDNINTSPAVPEPGTMLLLGSGLLGLAARRRRTS